MKRMMTWACLLTKRMYKKASFLVLLILIPCLVIGYGALSREESGVLTVVLCQEDPQDPGSSAFIQSLTEGSDLILFLTAQTPEQAEDMVRFAEADAAWIIPDDFNDRIARYAKDRFSNNRLVRVIVREESVTVMLCLEKLGSTIFARTVRELFADYMENALSPDQTLSRDEILHYYDSLDYDRELFDFSYTTAGKLPENARNYLLSPLRGLLGVFVIIGGMVSAMYYIQDDQQGLFSWIPYRRRFAVEYGYLTVPVVNICLVVFVSLLSVGLTAGVLQEILITIVYAILCTSFCQMLRIWCKNVQALGALLPVLSICMIVLCPIFFDLSETMGLGYLFPPTYFINAAYDPGGVAYMLAYTAICQGMYWLGKTVLRRN